YGQPLSSVNPPLELLLIDNQNLIGYNGSVYRSNVRPPVQQTGSIISRGQIDKVDIGFGGNFLDKLYFGFNLGIPILNYSINQTMEEDAPNGTDSITHFQTYSLNSEYALSGVGVTG